MSMSRLDQFVHQSDIYFTYHFLPNTQDFSQIFIFDSSVFSDELTCREFLDAVKQDTLVIAAENTIAQLERFVRPEQSIEFRSKYAYQYPTDQEIIIALLLDSQDGNNLKCDANLENNTAENLARPNDMTAFINSYADEERDLLRSISVSSVESIFLSPEIAKKSQMLNRYSMFITPFNAGNQLKAAFALKSRINFS